MGSLPDQFLAYELLNTNRGTSTRLFHCEYLTRFTLHPVTLLESCSHIV